MGLLANSEFAAQGMRAVLVELAQQEALHPQLQATLLPQLAKLNTSNAIVGLRVLEAWQSMAMVSPAVLRLILDRTAFLERLLQTLRSTDTMVALNAIEISRQVHVRCPLPPASSQLAFRIKLTCSFNDHFCSLPLCQSTAGGSRLTRGC